MYNDLSALKSLDDGKNSDASIKAVAQQFESVFVKMMLDSMRDANAVFSEGSYLNSNETDFYQDMLDNQLSLTLSQGKGMGLADVIYRQLSQYNAKPQRVETLDQTTLSDRSVGPAVMQGQEIPASAGMAEGAQHSSLSTQHSALSTQHSELISFSTPEEFIQHLQPLADKVGRAMGVDPKALLAQAALETGWGKYINQNEQGASSYNLFNIKADARWSGDRISVATVEYNNGVAVRERAQFRAYNNFEESFNDYLKFISESPRYQQALEQGSNASQYATELQQAGYATDPRYADKIGQILSSNVFNTVRGA